MRENSGKTVCHTPTPGKQPTAIPTWKYEAVRRAIQQVVPDKVPGLLSKDLPGLVKNQLTNDELQALGSVTWHTTCVRLNMEVEGELKRVAKSKPLRIIQCQ